MTATLEEGEWSAARPGRTLPPGNTRYSLYRRLGGPQGRSGRAENLVPHRDSIPDCPPRSSVAIPTELPGPQRNVMGNKMKNLFMPGTKEICVGGVEMTGLTNYFQFS